MEKLIKQRIRESLEVKEKIMENEVLIKEVELLAKKIEIAIRKNHKLVICGNGGSASDALHFAGEIVGRFQKERTAWPAVVLNADVATLTAIANDYGYENVFARQAQGQVEEGDVFIGISTSGNSINVLKAIEVAEKKGAVTAALLGKDGGKIKEYTEFPIIVPCDATARVQECHIMLIHIICEIVENELTRNAEIW